MTSLTECLRILHRLHRQLGDISDRLRRGPLQIKAREANLAKLQTEVEEIEQEAKETRMTADQKELLLKSREQKIKDLQAKLNSCKTNREYQAIREQIAADEMACSVLSDEILEVYERSDEIQARVPEVKEKAQKTQQELESTRTKIQESEEKLLSERERLQGELQEAEKKLPAAERDTYRRLVKQMAADALAPIEGKNRVCGGCYQQIPLNDYNRLCTSQIVYCRSCGRLLYLPEGNPDLLEA
ncbi:Phospholipase [Planctomycetales bacterium 10988]|nr:Phospholipase [Planctomycetales bacterium 10988]